MHTKLNSFSVPFFLRWQIKEWNIHAWHRPIYGFGFVNTGSPFWQLFSTSAKLMDQSFAWQVVQKKKKCKKGNKKRKEHKFIKNLWQPYAWLFQYDACFYGHVLFLVAEKLNWIFNLYDVDRDGYISKSELLLITSAIYEMLGKHAPSSCITLITTIQTGERAVPRSKIKTPQDHVDMLFNVSSSKSMSNDQFFSLPLPRP